MRDGFSTCVSVRIGRRVKDRVWASFEAPLRLRVQDLVCGRVARVWIRSWDILLGRVLEEINDE